MGHRELGVGVGWWYQIKGTKKGTTEGKMVGWHHRLDGYELEQAPGAGQDRETWSVQSTGSQSRTRLSD